MSATLSGLVCAEGIAKTVKLDRKLAQCEPACPEDMDVRGKYLPELQKIAAEALGIYRGGDVLMAARNQVEQMLDNDELKKDDYTAQCTLSVKLILQAAQNRKESRGTHNRLDYPETLKEYERSFTV